MKKASDVPSAASLRELPEVEFAGRRVRRNPYATRIAREGIAVYHREPTAASLAEIPPAAFAGARVARNPYVTRAADAPGVQYGRGRPRRGAEVGPTQVRSLRLPAPTWAALEAEAAGRHTTVHAIVRELIDSFLARSDR